MKMHDTVYNILQSTNKSCVDFTGDDLNDALSFGFSFIESEDHYVNYIVANPSLMKRIFGEISDSVLNPKDDSVGELWTAKLILSNRLGDKRILLSNKTYSAVINLNLNPHPYKEI